MSYIRVNFQLTTFLFLLLTLFTQSVFSKEISISQKESQEVKDIKGRLEIRISSPLPGQSPSVTIQYELITNTNTYDLIFEDTPPDQLKTNTLIHIKRGQLIQGSKTIRLYAKDLLILKVPPTPDFSALNAAQKAVVFLVNFEDTPNTKPWTVSQIKGLFDGSVNNMLKEFSYGKTTLSADVFGWYTLSGVRSNQDCNSFRSSLTLKTLDIAKTNGIDINNYSNWVFIFPNNFNCNWAGLATMGGKSSWINGYLLASVITHELGHNFGLWHANFLKCSTGTESGACSVVEYGDYADTMGYVYHFPDAHFNAYQKERVAWLNDKTLPSMKTVTTSGSYTILPYEVADNGIKALKVLKKTNADGSSDYFYLEFRQPIGFDRNIGTCSQCDFTKGVLIHKGNSVNTNTSHLLDISPNDNNPNLVALLPGKSYQDPTAANGGVTFTVNSVSAAGATVQVLFGTTPPPPPNYDYVYPDGRLNYKAGTIVLGFDNRRYQCKPWPYSGWCSGSPLYYEPGRGLAWQQAWNVLS